MRWIFTSLAVVLVLTAVAQNNQPVPSENKDKAVIEKSNRSEKEKKPQKKDEKYAPLNELQPKVISSMTWEGIGSFRAEGSGDLEVSINGTILFNDLRDAKSVVIGQGIKLERAPETKMIGGRKITRTVYYGKGTIKIQDARFRAVLFFGKEMKGSFKGVGMVRLTGLGKWSTSEGLKGEISEATASIYVPQMQAPKPQQPPGDQQKPAGPGDGHENVHKH